MKKTKTKRWVVFLSNNTDPAADDEAITISAASPVEAISKAKDRCRNLLNRFSIGAVYEVDRNQWRKR